MSNIKIKETDFSSIETLATEIFRCGCFVELTFANSISINCRIIGMNADRNRFVLKVRLSNGKVCFIDILDIICVKKLLV